MDYYKQLGIPMDAEKAAVKRAYFEKVKTHTPDKDPVGFKLIRNAYETLYDDKKRAHYDKSFNTQNDAMDEILSAREMIVNHNLKQAIDYITAQPDTYRNNAALMLLLAQAYQSSGKSGKAESTCKEVLAKHPENASAWHFRGVVAQSRGHYNKAYEYFSKAVKLDPMNANIWTSYLDFLEGEDYDAWLEATLEAMRHSVDMFKDEYFRYPHFIFSFREDVSDDESHEWLATFVKYFLLDENPEDGVYRLALNTLPLLCMEQIYAEEIKKIYPKLQNCPYRIEGHQNALNMISAGLAHHELKGNDRIDPGLAELTIKTMLGNASHPIKHLEAGIIRDIAGLRKSVKYLRDNFPQYYELNAAFLNKVINPDKERELISEVYNRISTNHPGVRRDTEDLSERQSQKTGRNAPCPCGSGKKYKRCCG